jgi:hypothetical protein
VEYVVAWGLEHRHLEAIQAIGVDEIQYAKGHGADHQTSCAKADHVFKGRLDLAFGAGVQDGEFKPPPAGSYL